MALFKVGTENTELKEREVSSIPVANVRPVAPVRPVVTPRPQEAAPQQEDPMKRVRRMQQEAVKRQAETNLNKAQI